MSHYTALLTGTIDSSVYNNVENLITNTEERRRQYESSIERYITLSSFDQIVFAENSGYPFEAERFSSLAKKHGKAFEYLQCKPHIEMTVRFGKGYGESLIIQEALDNSRLLREENEIYKITGRIFLHNSKRIIKSSRGKNEFYIIDSEKQCYTHLFKFYKPDYYRFLYHSDLAIRENSLNLEHTFYQLLRQGVSQGMKITCFKYWGDFDGIQGSLGQPYRSSKKGKVYHDLLCIFKAYTFDSKFQRYIRF